MSGLASFIVALLLLAAFLRIDFFHYLFYLTVGIVVLGRWWAQRAAGSVSHRREYPERVFWGEQPLVRLEIHNRGYLPVLWLRIHDSLPIEVRSPNFYHQALSLLPRERVTLSYRLDCHRRGYYRLGPLALEAGDLLGTTRVSLSYDDADTLIVYPRIIPLTDLGLPSRTLYGSLRSKQRIFEDPSRVLGVRDYVPGDSLRHVAWKTSAIVGRLQVKRYQPAIALDTTVLVDLDRASYSQMRLYVATELAIVVAASLANWLVEHRQAVGLCTNGRDPLAADEEGGRQGGTLLRPRKGRDALMRVLDLLARVEISEGQDFPSLLQRHTGRLPWGSTLAIVTGRVGDALFEALAHLRRAGFSLVLYSVDPSAAFEAIRRRAAQIGVASYEVWEEADLERGALAAGRRS
ncbi:MAG: DUF58 domain-containing protein [Anaerolineae bacterium]|nr:DUF58 domain-containing protein [Anaerolineae bacterium]